MFFVDRKFVSIFALRQLVTVGLHFSYNEDL